MNRKEITNSQDYKATKAALKWWYSLSEEQRKTTDIDAEPDIVDAYSDGVIYGWNNPNWISVDDAFPPHRNQTNHKFENDFSVNCFVSDGKDVDTGYYDYRLHKWSCEFLTNVIYWYCPQPPRKEE